MNSKIKSDYLLFEERPVTGEYNHLGIAKDIVACTRYFETFFHEYTDKYLLGQTIVKVKTFRIIDSNGNAFIEDGF